MQLDQSADGCGLGLPVVCQLCDQLGCHVNLTRSTRNSKDFYVRCRYVHSFALEYEAYTRQGTIKPVNFRLSRFSR